MKILAIETSCDEAAAANPRQTGALQRCRLSGGGTPHIRGVVRNRLRRHAEAIVGICEDAVNQAGVNLNEIDAVAATYAPGLSARCWWALISPKGWPLLQNP